MLFEIATPLPDASWLDAREVITKQVADAFRVPFGMDELTAVRVMVSVSLPNLLLEQLPWKETA